VPEEPEDEEESEEPVAPVEPPPAAERPEEVEPVEVPDPDVDESLLEARVVPPAETTSPTWPESVTIVPSCGA